MCTLSPGNSQAVPYKVTHSADLDLVHVGYLYKKASIHRDTNSDWALIRISSGFSRSKEYRPRRKHVPSRPSVKYCRINSASGIFKHGIILESSINMRMPGQHRFGEVLVVEMTSGKIGKWTIYAMKLLLTCIKDSVTRGPGL